MRVHGAPLRAQTRYSLAWEGCKGEGGPLRLRVSVLAAPHDSRSTEYAAASSDTRSATGTRLQSCGARTVAERPADAATRSSTPLSACAMEPMLAAALLRLDSASHAALAPTTLTNGLERGRYRLPLPRSPGLPAPPKQATRTLLCSGCSASLPASTEPRLRPAMAALCGRVFLAPCKRAPPRRRGRSPAGRRKPWSGRAKPCPHAPALPLRRNPAVAGAP